MGPMMQADCDLLRDSFKTSVIGSSTGVTEQATLLKVQQRIRARLSHRCQAPLIHSYHPGPKIGLNLGLTWGALDP